MHGVGVAWFNVPRDILLGNFGDGGVTAASARITKCNDKVVKMCKIAEQSQCINLTRMAYITLKTLAMKQAS